MNHSRQIVALGGGGFSMEPENRHLDEYLLSLSAAVRPRICFVPTASGDSSDYCQKFSDAFTDLNSEPTVFSLFRSQTWTGSPEEMLLDQDIIFVGGGSTANMLILWRAWGIDEILRKAYEEGIILSGISAGANCWFEQCSTDSLGPGTNVLDGLGWLTGSFTPHYDGEAERRSSLRKFIDEGIMTPGYAADDGVAIHFINESLYRVVSSRRNAKGYHVTEEGEFELETKFLDS
jgi:dipeptidase E